MSCILAIDDRPINLQFLTSLLSYDGHQVLEATDGEQGLRIVRERHPDLVITDIRMPRMDGYQFVSQMRLEPETADTPVIFYTAAYNEQEARSVAVSYGIADVITKPSQPGLILKKVNDALGQNSCVSTDAAKVDPRELDTLRCGLKLSALIELGMEQGTERDAEKLLSRFCSTAVHVIGASKGIVGVLSDDGEWLKHFMIKGLKRAAPLIHNLPSVHHPVLEQLVKDKKALRINGSQIDLFQTEPWLNNSRVTSMLGVPLVSSVGVYGWLVLLEKLNKEDFTEEDERLATTLAAQAAIAYENVLFSDLLQRKAELLDRVRREQVELRDQFISNVSHELRSPLSALHQFTTILLDGLGGELNPEQRDYLEVILDNSLQLRDMIDDLLEITRADHGKLTISKEAISFCGLMSSILPTYSKRAAEKNIVLRTAYDVSLADIQADPHRIKQITSNLLDNALKFTNEGEIRIHAGPHEDDDTFARVVISDTGCGIPATSLPKVFDRLYQSPNTIESSRKGLGLGLHICKQLVELHGGRIWIESKVDEGTKVIFTIPFSKVERKNQADEEQNSNHR